MAQSWDDLPEELWQAIFDCIKPTEYHHLESISLVCTLFQFFSNRLVSTLNVSTRTVLLAPDHRYISPQCRRSRHLKRINLTGSLSTDNVNSIIRAISRSDLRLTALDLSNQERFPYSAIHDLGRKMKDMTTLICAGRGFLNDQDLDLIAASFPDLEELDISYPRNRNSHLVRRGISDKGISGIAEKLQKLQSINISGNSFISDVSLTKLSSRSSLIKISARDCRRLTISGIDNVIQHRMNLHSLSISIKNPISSSDAFMERFRGNDSNLQSLELYQTCVSNELLYAIGDHKLVLLKLVLSDCHGFTFDGLSKVVQGQQLLQHLDLDGTGFLTDEMMSSLSEYLPHVFSIALNYCTHLTSSTIFNLAKNCPSLEEISMSYTSLGLGGEDLVSELGKNCKIRSLKLRSNENLRDETLKRIGTLCPELRSLDVSHCPSITGVGIGAIGKYCTNLVTLAIVNCTNLTELTIVNCTNLTEVTIVNCTSLTKMTIVNCTNLTKMTIVNCTNLKELSQLTIVNCTNVTEVTIVNCTNLTKVTIVNCTNLTKLTIVNCTNLTKATIVNCTNLTELSQLTIVNCTNLTELAIVNCTNLTELTIVNCTNLTKLAIVNCTNLTELTTINCTNLKNLGWDLQFSKLEVLMASESGIKDEGLEMIGRGCPRLRILHLKDCDGVTEKGLRQFSKLEVLMASASEIKDEGLEMIGRGCPRLQILHVKDCDGVTERGLRQFSKLEVLVASASGIKDEGLEMIGRGCPRLRILHVKDCDGVTEKGLRQLLKSDSSCKVLRKLNLERCCDLSADFLAWMVSASPSLRTIILSSPSLPTLNSRDLFLERGCLVTSTE